MSVAQVKRFLIWGKTAPQLSSTYYETVCTGGVLEDGTPIRLYPIPFRYLSENEKFKKYQWMTAAIERYSKDSRPESYRIDCDSIELGETIASDKNEWEKRAAVMFQQPGWQFQSVDALAKAQETSKQSIGVVTPQRIVAVTLKQRPDDELLDFNVRKAAIQKKYSTDREQLRLFEEGMPDEMKGLEFQRNRIHVEWICDAGKSHNMQIMDWEVIELQRKTNDDKAVAKVREILNLDTHAIRFFLGNTKQHQNRFSICGIWYPKRQLALADKETGSAGLFG